MLNPNNERLDYGKILIPPSGYSLDFAVATTYSLDLDALVGACLSLGLSAETDSELLKNPLCLLEALRTTGDKIALFCESGQIHMPSSVSKLYILLEQMVYQVTNVKARKNASYPSFHPKFWLIRYVNEEGEFLYRVIVLSRNLTFDRSWDVSFYLDGLSNHKRTIRNTPIVDFLTFLSENLDSSPAGKHKKKKINELIEELAYVHFRVKDSEKEFSEVEFIPTGIPKTTGGEYSITDYPLFAGFDDEKKKENAHEIFIMSPFLSNDVIKFFNSRNKGLKNSEFVLVTRAMSLGKLKKEDCDNFRFFVLKDAVVDGERSMSEETVSDYMKQDIHAKVFMLRKYDESELYLGSLNASHNAVYGNIEFMIRLKSSDKYLNMGTILDSICCGEEGGVDSPFEEVSLKNMKEEEGDVNNLLDKEIKRLCRLKPMASVVSAADFYEIHVKLGKFESPYNITIKPLLSNNEDNELSISEELIFRKLSLNQLSEFFVVTVSDEDKNKVSRLVKFKVSGIPEDRDKAVISSVITDRASFYRYIAFLLGDNMILSALEAQENVQGGSGNNRKYEVLPPLYEKMLKTAASAPMKFKDIETLINAVSGDDILPDGFMDLYATFREVVKENG